MLSTTRSRATSAIARRSFAQPRRHYAFSGNDKQEITDNTATANVPNVSKTNELPMETHMGDKALQENSQDGEHFRVRQAKNRMSVWSRSQNPRAKAMSGPRFEQTIMEFQPSPAAAIELIHKQPVRWVKERMVSCDGGGGILGHPKIFINVDKPQINMCTYCGLPFANEHHRAHIESLPETPYPLVAQGDEAEVQESQRITDEPYGQR